MLKNLMTGKISNRLMVQAIVFITILIVLYIFVGGGRRDDFIVNLITEGLGVWLTLGIIDQFLKMRDRKTAEQQYQEQLRREASSISNDVALNAVHLLRVNGWLTKDNSLLKNISLKKANLKKAPLDECNLEETNFEAAILDMAELSYANLNHCNLSQASLQNATLVGTRMHNCHLFATNLSDSSLSYAELQDSDCEGTNFNRANLENANLSSTNLKNANFTDASLTDCNFENATFDNTILPDGTICDSYADFLAHFKPGGSG